jgi:hypothetical protein
MNGTKMKDTNKKEGPKPHVKSLHVKGDTRKKRPQKRAARNKRRRS